jgi:hypothetical protein
MYLLEEYLAAILVAVFLGFAGSVILLVLSTLITETRLLDRALPQGVVTLPPHWPRLWLFMRIARRWRELPPALLGRLSLWWRRVNFALWTCSAWKRSRREGVAQRQTIDETAVNKQQK